MKRLIKAAAVDQTIDVFIQDSSSIVGAGLTGLVFNTASLTCYYRRGPTGANTALTLATQTVAGAHSDGGFVEISAANMPGWYRLDLSDAMVAAGVPALGVQLKGAANMAPVNLEIQFDPVVVDTTVAMAEAYAAKGAAMTPAQALYLILALLQEKSASGVTVSAKKLDGTTVAATFTLSDASNPTSITRAT